MAKVIYSMFASVDGYVASADGGLDWLFPDEELHGFVNEQSRAITASLYGRRLFELMADYWPTVQDTPQTPRVEADFARFWRETEKIVFSTTLGSHEWADRVIGEDVPGAVARIKGELPGEVDVGGPTLAAELIRHGLVDEYRQFVFPVVLGDGLPFFPGLNRPEKLRLVESRTFDSGVVYLRYAV
ncbi:dihydrofolate reductase family protein [Nocardiopsis nanhaiensis]